MIMCFAGSLSKTLGSRESTGALLLSFQAQEFATYFCFTKSSLLADFRREVGGSSLPLDVIAASDQLKVSEIRSNIKAPAPHA